MCSSCSTRRPAGATGRPSCRRRAHAASGRWAGRQLGRLHAATAGDADVAAAFGDYEAFAQLRLRAVSRNRDGPPPPARRRHPTARRGAARRAHVPRTRRLRAQEHPARPRRRAGCWTRRSRTWSSGLRPGVLPRVPAAHGAAAAGARGGLQRDHRGASPRPTAAARARRRPAGGRWRSTPARCCSRAPTAARRRRSSRPRAWRARALGRAHCCSIRRPTWRRSWRHARERALDRAGARVRGARFARNADGGLHVSLAGGAQACATVPAGASTGRHEAHERRDGG